MISMLFNFSEEIIMGDTQDHRFGKSAGREEEFQTPSLSSNSDSGYETAESTETGENIEENVVLTAFLGLEKVINQKNSGLTEQKKDEFLRAIKALKLEFKLQLELQMEEQPQSLVPMSSDLLEFIKNNSQCQELRQFLPVQESGSELFCHKKSCDSDGSHHQSRKREEKKAQLLTIRKRKKSLQESRWIRSINALIKNIETGSISEMIKAENIDEKKKEETIKKLNMLKYQIQYAEGDGEQAVFEIDPKIADLIKQFCTDRSLIKVIDQEIKAAQIDKPSKDFVKAAKILNPVRFFLSRCAQLLNVHQSKRQKDEKIDPTSEQVSRKGKAGLGKKNHS